jgi:3-phenylpropionate/trans-cinnamate dioxygenase ferredoxin component
MIECPLHAASFDLRTGKPTGPPAKRPVRTYTVLVEDGVVYVDAPARKATVDAMTRADTADVETQQGVA